MRKHISVDERESDWARVQTTSCCVSNVRSKKIRRFLRLKLARKTVAAEAFCSSIIYMCVFVCVCFIEVSPQPSTDSVLLVIVPKITTCNTCCVWLTSSDDTQSLRRFAHCVWNDIWRRINNIWPRHGLKQHKKDIANRPTDMASARTRTYEGFYSPQAVGFFLAARRKTLNFCCRINCMTVRSFSDHVNYSVSIARTDSGCVLFTPDNYWTGSHRSTFGGRHKLLIVCRLSDWT